VTRWWVILVVAASGCNQIFGVEKTKIATPKCAVDDDDCDQIPNAIDLCPADPDDGTDTDADGVGDACDPSPTLAGDSIAMFYPMVVVDSMWAVGVGGTWTFDNSALNQTNISVDATTEHPAPPSIIEPTVEVVIEPTFAGDGSMVGAYVVASPSGFVLMCRVVHHDAGDELQMLYGSNLSSLTLAKTAGPLTPGPQLRLYGGQLPDSDHSVICRARYDAVGVAVTLDPALSRVLGRASFAAMGLGTHQATAAFDSVTVYTRQP
jgi:hypothetical protein